MTTNEQKEKDILRVSDISYVRGSLQGMLSAINMNGLDLNLPNLKDSLKKLINTLDKYTKYDKQ